MLHRVETGGIFRLLNQGNMCVYSHTHTYTLSQAHSLTQNWLPKQASKGLSNESYRSAEQKISLLD